MLRHFVVGRTRRWAEKDLDARLLEEVACFRLPLRAEQVLELGVVVFAGDDQTADRVPGFINIVTTNSLQIISCYIRPPWKPLGTQGSDVLLEPAHQAWCLRRCSSNSGARGCDYDLHVRAS